MQPALAKQGTHRKALVSDLYSTWNLYDQLIPLIQLDRALTMGLL